MLIISISLYLLLTILIGYWAARRVHTSQDFVLAGRSLPVVLSASALFATWFGSETVLGASSVFIEKGLYGVIEDPPGAALCLFLLGAFFARSFYRLGGLTLCDYYHDRFGKSSEFISGLLMVPSYFGWVAGQLVAMGIILNVVMGISTTAGVLLSAFVVLIYTYIGGMWAISVTDLMQTVIIVAGMLLVLFAIVDSVETLVGVVEQTPKGFFNVLPPPTLTGWLQYIAAWTTISFGSIPQQDIFQRVMASKSEKAAVASAYWGAGMYLTIAAIPLMIALCARQLYPDVLSQLDDAQLFLPTVVMRYTNTFTQIMFFGALLSAIMSTTSGAILAPATILGENIIKPFIKDLTDAKLLMSLRISIIVVAMFSCLMAILDTNIYELVSQSSAISMASLFVPLLGGFYWKKANSMGANASMLLGIVCWLGWEVSGSEIPSVIPAFLVSIAGMVGGTYMGIWIEKEK